MDENNMKDRMIYDSAVLAGRTLLENEKLKKEIETMRNNAIEMEREMNNEIDLLKSLVSSIQIKTK